MPVALTRTSGRTRYVTASPHMLQQGVDIRIIQMYSDTHIRSTEIYTHLTNPLRDQLRQLLFQTTDGLFEGRRRSHV